MNFRKRKKNWNERNLIKIKKIMNKTPKPSPPKKIYGT